MPDATPIPGSAADEHLTTVGMLFESTSGLRKLFSRQMEADHGVATQAFDVLIRLVRTPGHALRMSELATQTSLSPSGLTRSVDRLTQQGLVVRQACPDDRRGSLAVMTPEGQALMARLVPDHVAQVESVLAAVFSPDERTELAALLRRLRDHLAEVNGGIPAGDEQDSCPTLSEGDGLDAPCPSLDDVV